MFLRTSEIRRYTIKKKKNYLSFNVNAVEKQMLAALTSVVHIRYFRNNLIKLMS